MVGGAGGLDLGALVESHGGPRCASAVSPPWGTQGPRTPAGAGRGRSGCGVGLSLGDHTTDRLPPPSAGVFAWQLHRFRAVAEYSVDYPAVGNAHDETMVCGGCEGRE